MCKKEIKYALALIVCGDDIRKMLISDYLLNASWDIMVFSDGLRALEALRKHHFDVVVLDESVQGMEPLEFAMYVRELAVPPGKAIAIGEQLQHHAGVLKRCGFLNIAASEDALEAVHRELCDGELRAVGNRNLG